MKKLNTIIGFIALSLFITGCEQTPTEPLTLSIGDICIQEGGTWLEDFSECEYVPQNVCDSLNGTYNECGSACRNDKDAEICTQQCVAFCAFEEEANTDVIEEKTTTE